MKIISNDTYMEYQQLKRNARVQSNFDSVRQLGALKNDIDVPVRSLVVMLALLGCEPLFSCCGFDYDGQPSHKTHEYGCVYFQMRSNNWSNIVLATLENSKIINKLTNKSPDWEWWKIKDTLFLRSAFTLFHDKNYPWVTSEDCIHYSEVGVLNIDRLEKALWGLRERFSDVAEIVDTNHVYKNDRNIRNWQYPTLEPWSVTIDDVFGECG